jgi:hypothetical protein
VTLPPRHRAAASAFLLVVTLEALSSPLALGAPSGRGGGEAVVSEQPAAGQRLTNLAHLDFLGDRVDPPDRARHTTYRMAARPRIGVLWTYSEPQDDGSYNRIGGGAYDPQTNTYEQGAYNADDMTRAAVVYLRHWQRFGDDHSRRHAKQLLRGVTYLQTSSGPNRGNVVLWMQPDGTLNRSPVIEELPDPSDSGPSYWLGRTMWALGEGYAAFKDADPQFAGFLRDRMELAIGALNRQVLDPNFGTFKTVDGLRWPAWLLVDGADASAEPTLGLAAYVEAGGGSRARGAMRRLAEGIAAMPLGRARRWPFGAIMPWTLSRSVWHAWGDQMGSALARAGTVLGRDDLVAPALGEAGRFTPHMLIQAGPEQGWLPGLSDTSQIAYGADSTVQNLVRVAGAANRPAFRRMAGIAAAWYFGNNPSGAPMYDPSTGRTFDGVSGDGEVNVNSGAESTIHGLLSMLTLDSHPGIAERARIAGVTGRVTWAYAEAESGAVSGGSVETPPDPWTGESLWGGGSYVELDSGGSVSIPVDLPVTDRYHVFSVFDRRPVPRGTVGLEYDVGGVPAGAQDHGGAGPQGVTPTPGYRAVGRVTTDGRVPAGSSEIVARYAGEGLRPARLDAVMVQPRVEWLLLGGEGAGQGLLRSFSTTRQIRRVALEGTGRITAVAYNKRGRPVGSVSADGSTVRAPVAAGGFTIVSR